MPTDVHPNRCGGDKSQPGEDQYPCGHNNRRQQDTGKRIRQRKRRGRSTIHQSIFEHHPLAEPAGHPSCFAKNRLGVAAVLGSIFRQADPILMHAVNGQSARADHQQTRKALPHGEMDNNKLDAVNRQAAVNQSQASLVAILKLPGGELANAASIIQPANSQGTKSRTSLAAAERTLHLFARRTIRPRRRQLAPPSR